MNRYRVDRVDRCPYRSHADFFFPSVIAKVTRLSDQHTFQIKVKMALALSEGQEVALDDQTILSSSVTE